MADPGVAVGPGSAASGSVQAAAAMSGSFRRIALDQADPHRARLVELVDRLAGDIVLEHVAGRRVLDLGHGAPEVTHWVEQRASLLQIVDAEVLEQALEFPDESFDTVVCLRTLPHVGRDEETSLAAASTLLRETARVLAPDGVALVQIDNPRSLLGLYHGVRNPMTLVGAGSLVVEPAKGITRFDTLGRIRELLPPTLELQAFHGLRVLVPLPHLLGIPLIGRMLAWGEWVARDNPLLRRFGAHLLLVLRRLPAGAAGE